MKIENSATERIYIKEKKVVNQRKTKLMNIKL
jgi:hypothetical protein